MSLTLRTGYYLRCDRPLCLNEIWKEGDTPRTKASLLRAARSWGWEVPSEGVGTHYCPDCKTDSEEEA